MDVKKLMKAYERTTNELFGVHAVNSNKNKKHKKRKKKSK